MMRESNVGARRARRAGWVVLGGVVAVTVGACGASGGDQGGYVLLDPDARGAGLSIEVNGQAITSALPVAIPAGAHASLVGAEHDEPLEVGSDELVYVQGARATVQHLRIGGQVAVGELRLIGDEPAARQLASEVGASVESTVGEWHLRSPDVFAASSSAHVPASLLGVAPVLVTATPAPAPRVATAPVIAAARPEQTATIPAALAPIAIAAPAPARVQTDLPVAFTAASECSGASGTWRGRAFSERHGQYYDFTLKVSQGASGVTGTVRAEFWSAERSETEPPQSCSGALHATVIESGSGTLAGGTLHFASKRWSVQGRTCGESGIGYSPDRFDMPLAEGSVATDAIVSDDAVWSDGMPVKLTRVSCR